MSSPSDQTSLAEGFYCGAAGHQAFDGFDDARICRCSDCRRATGFAPRPFSGIAVCGTLLFSVVKDGTWVQVTRGTLTDTPTPRPTEAIFTGPKAVWYKFTDGLPQHARFPQ